MKLIIVSGRSGSGKSTALHVLEDLGFYCIDNLPVGLLLQLGEQITSGCDSRLENVAVSIDARNLESGIEQFPNIYASLKTLNINIEVMYLDASAETILKRFHATRRKHPLSSNEQSLSEAIEKEHALLAPISRVADLAIDTTNLSLYELRDLIKMRVTGKTSQDLAILFQSFGFKYGAPNDADFIFDVRCLPNPYWDTNLRRYTGLEPPIVEFMKAQPESQEMIDHLINFFDKWLPQFQASNRSYLTIAIGCTGGHHRSVYICEALGKHYQNVYNNVQIRHREIVRPPS